MNKVSTLYDSSIIILGIYEISSHAAFESAATQVSYSNLGPTRFRQVGKQV